MRRTRLRAVSKKRAGELVIYYGLRRDFLAEHQICEARHICRRAGHNACAYGAQDVHHVRGRGPNLNKVDSWIAVCRPCHEWIHSHPGEARMVGLLLPS